MQTEFVLKLELKRIIDNEIGIQYINLFKNLEYCSTLEGIKHTLALFEHQLTKFLDIKLINILKENRKKS